MVFVAPTKSQLLHRKHRKYRQTMRVRALWVNSILKHIEFIGFLFEESLDRFHLNSKRYSNLKPLPPIKKGDPGSQTSILKQ